MTFGCAMRISKAGKEVCKACFRKHINISKEHVPGIGNFSLANTRLFFANRYVPVSLARSDTKPCFRATRPRTRSYDPEVRVQVHRWEKAPREKLQQNHAHPSRILQRALLLISPKGTWPASSSQGRCISCGFLNSRR